MPEPLNCLIIEIVKSKMINTIYKPVLHQKSFQELTVDELYELLRVRSEVFVVEQDCVYQDREMDAAVA